MYDTSAYTDPALRVPGFHDVHCRVTWTPRDTGDAVIISGPYLDAESQGAPVTLGCGIESVIHDLGLDDLVEYDHLVPLADAVSEQLERRPHAEIRCRQGIARLDLIPFSEASVA